MRPCVATSLDPTIINSDFEPWVARSIPRPSACSRVTGGCSRLSNRVSGGLTAAFRLVESPRAGLMAWATAHISMREPFTEVELDLSRGCCLRLLQRRAQRSGIAEGSRRRRRLPPASLPRTDVRRLISLFRAQVARACRSVGLSRCSSSGRYRRGLAVVAVRALSISSAFHGGVASNQRRAPSLAVGP